MKKLIFLLLVLVLFPALAKAQQDALFSQYMFNMLLVNPAYAGSREVVSLNALGRKQWIGIPGAPETATFSADMPFRNETMGAGITLFNDRIGVFSNTGMYASYAYRLQLTKSTLLSAGVSAGFTNFQANFTSVQLDEFGNSGDLAFSQDLSRFLPNVGIGLFLNSDKYYIGFSIPQMLTNRLDLDRSYSARQYRHIFLMGGYVFTLNQHLKLKPSTLIKQVHGAPIQVDLNANLWLYDRYSVGISYRSLTAPVLILEMQLLDQFRLGYAFDYTHSQLRYYNNGTHEIMLRYEFGYDKRKMVSPRHF
ncbi:type IX secretion system membrane protein PorP/SprF [Cytophagaceae bacterium ABcell3]|nr:type IX secretion system membrane protein PorP/SprF [Cytophagaceae bacterium ABcell3]